MDPVYDFRMLQLRFMRWVTVRELARGVSKEGKGILEEIDAAIAVEEAEHEIAAALAQGDMEKAEQRIAAIASARDVPPPVIEVGEPYDHDGNPEDDGLATDEIECVKCGVEMAVAHDPTVSIFPVCPMCSTPGLAEAAAEAGAADEDQE